MSKYSLVGVDGNAFAIMAYTADALRKEGLSDLIDDMHTEATSGNYYHLVAVCDGYVRKANEMHERRAK